MFRLCIGNYLSKSLKKRKDEADIFHEILPCLGSLITSFDQHSKEASVKHLKKKVNSNYISRARSYRAVNTLRFGYKSKSVNAV
jgi:hypothetical protein